MLSRYLVTVRRAILCPCSLSRSVIFWSGERFSGFSPLMISAISAFDGDDGLVVAFAVFELCREEVAQLVDAAFAHEVFAIDRAADGAFVDVEHFRDFLPGERPHRRFAFLEEVLLQGDDDVGDAADGVGAFVDGGQKPARFLQLGPGAGFCPRLWRFRRFWRTSWLIGDVRGGCFRRVSDVAECRFFSRTMISGRCTCGACSL